MTSMLSAIHKPFCTECSCAECRYAECRYVECRYAECRYVECRYAECRYAECRSANTLAYSQLNCKKFFNVETRSGPKLQRRMATLRAAPSFIVENRQITKNYSSSS
jgi:hypothetical protein